jgi:hypothetical protein
MAADDEDVDVLTFARPLDTRRDDDLAWLRDRWGPDVALPEPPGIYMLFFVPERGKPPQPVLVPDVHAPGVAFGIALGRGGGDLAAKIEFRPHVLLPRLDPDRHTTG